MTYYQKYHCINCPVEKYCGTVVGCFKLCHSYKEEDTSSPVLTLSSESSDVPEK